ncbi:MAG: hypothetical protein J6K55_16370 [Clostridia bacterium]|nr:hypothetical protein [Clostridia bacterium]
MTLEEMKQQVMFQTGNDADDLGDFLPHVVDYLNDGYDRLMFAHCGIHVTIDGAVMPLVHDKSMPELPQWAHAAIADWATWRIYRNGAAARQARGLAFRASFEETERRLRNESAARMFKNLPM